MVPLPSWWQKLELNDLSISELFKDLLSWNSEYKRITSKNIIGTYFGAIMAIFNFSFSVCFLYVMFFLTPERAPKASPATCFIIIWIFFSKGSNFRASHHKESPIFIWAIFVNEYYIPNQIFWSNMYVYEYKGYWKNILFK